MDKNTIIGFFLIALIMFGFFKWTEPSKEELAHIRMVQQVQQDSIARAIQIEQENQKIINLQKSGLVNDSVSFDSAQVIIQKNNYGAFYSSLKGEEKIYTLENEKLKIEISSKGAQVVSVELKQDKKFDGSKLILFNRGDNRFSFQLTGNNRYVPTSDLYFSSDSPLSLDASKDSKTLSLSVIASNGKLLKFEYTLAPDDYKLDFAMTGDGLANSLATNSTFVALNWDQKLPQIEKGRTFEQRYSRIYFRYSKEEGVDRMNDAKNDDKVLNTSVEWISFKDQFFSTILRAPTSFQSGKLNSEFYEKGDYLKNYTSEMIIPYVINNPIKLEFYYLPNKLKILRSMGNEKEFEGLVPMGWGIFGWINKFAVVRVFNFLEGFTSNYGLIILLLTLIIKLVIFPFTFKSYLSTAKMRLLKPEIDEINERIPKEKALERQKATTELYSKAGVSPLGGCIPMLFQMPILFAMYSFFPVAFELRQQSFLWAKDLSSYDEFISWGYHIPGIGDHLSLFCLLMTITNIIYTWINSSATASQAGSMPFMKYMMYGMPVMFFFVLNDYASGLSYYYFVSTLITIIQTIAMRYMVNEDKLMNQIEENKKKKTGKKKSNWQARLEKMQREQQQIARNRKK